MCEFSTLLHIRVMTSFTVLWPDPYREVDSMLYNHNTNELLVCESQRADQVDEEEKRRAKVQQLLEGVDVNPYKNNVRETLCFVSIFVCLLLLHFQ